MVLENRPLAKMSGTKNAGRNLSRLLLCLAILVLATACSRPGLTSEARPESEAAVPTNVGYLRAADPTGGKLVTFNAETFEVHKAVDLPPSTSDFSHRLEIGPAGRVWLGYNQTGLDQITKFGPGARDRVLVFSHDGNLEHELDIGCSPPDT